MPAFVHGKYNLNENKKKILLLRCIHNFKSDLINRLSQHQQKQWVFHARTYQFKHANMRIINQLYHTAKPRNTHIFYAEYYAIKIHLIILCVFISYLQEAR